MEDDDVTLMYSGGGLEPVPISLPDDGSFPTLKYRSRGQAVKTAVHWGQRKLLISEMQLLTYFCLPKVSYWIVYVGAAPGSHLMFLDALYNGLHTWELIDPGQWDHRYSTLAADQAKRFVLRNEFFSNVPAYGLVQQRLCKARCPALSSVYNAVIQHELDEAADALLRSAVTDGSNAEAARTTDIPIKYEAPIQWTNRALELLLRVAADRCPMLFISDIRSGSEKVCKVGEFDLHVAENMRAQEAWCDIVNPTFAMLKFRLPYAFTSRYDFDLKRQVAVPSLLPPQSTHPTGTMLLPVWTRPTSTECRLVVPAYAGKRVYDHVTYEDQLFFFNSVLRERVHFPHPFHGHPWVDHHFDGAAEVRLLIAFVNQQRAARSAPLLGESSEAMRAAVAKLVEDISIAIGGSFEKAFANRESIHVGKAQRAGWMEETNARLAAARSRRAESFWRRALMPQELETRREPIAMGLVPFTPSRQRPNLAVTSNDHEKPLKRHTVEGQPS
jgi:cap3/cap4 methyltransferase